MNYKERTFEVDNDSISYENKFIIPFIIGIFTSAIIFGYSVYARELTPFICWSFGCLFGLSSIILIFGFSKIYQTKILLSEISHIEVNHFKTDADKSIFRGTAQFRNYFPAGFDKKKVDKLILIHQTKRKIIIGLTPDNCTAAISAMRENGINVIE
jgi:hypothetical protein